MEYFTAKANHGRTPWSLSVALAIIFVTANVIHAQTKSDSMESLLNQAFELEKGKNYGAAEGVYRKALLISPDDPEILKRLGLVCQEQGKNDESIEIFQKNSPAGSSLPRGEFIAGDFVLCIKQVR